MPNQQHSCIKKTKGISEVKNNTATSLLTEHFATQRSGTGPTLHPVPLGLNIIGGKMEDVLDILCVCVFYGPE